MIVKGVNDICVQVLDDPEHDQKFKGKFVEIPNSIRRDIPMKLTITKFDTVSDKVIKAKRR